MQQWSQIAGNGCDSDIQRKQMPQSLDHQRVCTSEINICKWLLEKRSQQICISSINSHLFFPDKIGSLTPWCLSRSRLFLLELAVPEPRLAAQLLQAPSVPRGGTIQSPWGQDPFTAPEPAWLKPHADCREEAGNRLEHSWDRNVTLHSADQSCGSPPLHHRPSHSAQCLQLAQTAQDAAAASLAPAATHRDAPLLHPPAPSLNSSPFPRGSQPCKVMFLMSTNRNK